MADRRPFPPSPRRRALARAAGLTAASPLLVAGVALAAGAIGVLVLGRAAAATLGAAIAAACDDRATLAPAALATAVLALVTPLLGAVAIVAALAHVAQTRALWLPRRRVPDAPAPPRAAGRRTALELANAAVIGGVAFGWLWAMSPRLGAAATAEPGAIAALVASALAAFAIAMIVLGVLDALVRHAQVGGALAMTAAEKREDDRLAAADPRWSARRDALARTSTTDAVAGAAVVVLGDDVAVAVAWDPVRRPVPLCAAVGRGPLARQLVALARRHRVAVHREPQLARALAEAAPRIGDAHWPRLAEIVAAVRPR